MRHTYPKVTDYFLLGRILKSHGTSGHLRIAVEDRYKRYLKPGNFLFLDLDGSKVPFEVVTMEEDHHFVIALDGINNKEQSDSLNGKEIWVPLEKIKDVHRLAPKRSKEDLKGYILQDHQTGATYSILRTEEYPQQLMAIISVKGKEVLIPLHEQLIVEFDSINKVIEMKVSEGLLDL